jgi:hypothetical protein
MSDSSVQNLLDAARHHLWHDTLRVSVRRAGWVCAASMALAVIVHLVLWPVPVGVLAAAVLLPWLASLAWAASRRPSDADAALWIDRHLGGASAFTTLLDARSGPQTAATAQALRWLEQWTTAKVPEVRRSLGARRSSTHLARSLLTMIVCSALALFVLTLPDAAPPSRRQAVVATASGANDKVTLSSEGPAAAQLASEISSAFRPTETDSEAEREAGRSAPAAGPTSPDERGSPKAPPASASPGDRSSGREAGSGQPVDASATAGAGRSAAAVSGREAGDSADTRADGSVSPAPRGTMPAQGSASRVRLASGDRQADMGQAARFDDSLSVPGSTAARAAPAAAAATPPPAVKSALLSPTETSYVQAWMKATGPSR